MVCRGARVVTSLRVTAALVLLAGCGVEEIPYRDGAVSPPRVASDGGASDVGPSDVGPSDGGAGQPGVTIDGVFWPRDKVIVLLGIGHSNMAGRASEPAELRWMSYDTHPQLWAYAPGGTWTPAREPTAADIYNEGRAGPGMSILRAALATSPDRIFVYIGAGRSGQIGGFCRNFRRDGLFYNLVMQPASELKGLVTFGAIFAMFGTSEPDDQENVPAFGACVRGVVAEMRADLGEPDLPFIMGDWEAEATGPLASPTSPDALIIRPQMQALPTEVSRFGLVDTTALPVLPNDHHYDLTGYKLWAERAIDILVKNRWTTWAGR